MKERLLVVLAGLWIAGCGEGDATMGDEAWTAGEEVTFEQNPGGADGSDPGEEPEVWGGESWPGDPSGDPGAGEGSDKSPGAVAPGAFGSPCDSDSDCSDGLCVDDGNARVCSMACLEECPGGWSCGGSAMPRRDQFSTFCLPPFVPYCRPCQDDYDCMRFEGDTLSACRPMGGKGSFCSVRCEEQPDCPAGSGCDGQWCVLLSGDCDCSGAASNVGYQTDCLMSNAHGSCPGLRVCQEDGLTLCLGDAAQPEVCDGEDNDCDGETDEDLQTSTCTQANEHGTCAGLTACLDGVLACQAPAAEPESCDGLDNDCDSQADEAGSGGCKEYYLDEDLDGFGGDVAVCLCAATLGVSTNDLDCDDLAPTVHLGALEQCDNQDNDCNGVADEGCDKDGDHFCGSVPLVWGPEAVCQYPDVDCNDFLGSVHPAAAELCDGLDNDCNGAADDGCDKDGDGYCWQMPFVEGAFTVCQAGMVDCDDTDPEVNPGAEEVCNAQDDDCDGTTDDDVCDLDKDGVCGQLPSPKAPDCFKPGAKVDSPFCKMILDLCPKGVSDCDDSDPWAMPGMVEKCNGKDDNCDGKVDETFDLDGDGYCVASQLIVPGCLKCKNPEIDCNDKMAQVHPAAADEIDWLGLDSNCDGLDGDLQRIVFVDSKSGMDGWAGTKDKPKKTVQGGIDEAFADPARDQVVVAAGTYKESLVLKKGARIWGGFRPEKGWTADGVAETSILGGPVAVTATKIDAYTVLGRMTIEAADATAPGASSIGIAASSSPSLVLTALKIKAGSGKDGNPGKDGSAGTGGANGAGAANGCFPDDGIICYQSWTDNTCPGFAKGGSGPGPTCGGLGDGEGTIPADSAWEPGPLSTWTGVGQGEPSCCYKVQGAVKGGQAGVEAGGPGKDGSAGQAGVDGANGTTGEGGNALGELGAGGWSGFPGGNGANGMPGCGGGGGGMGGTATDTYFFCDSHGGGGGGGAAGGGGGTGGKGGQAGGGSIGIALHKSPVQVEFCKITTAKGGAGGKGGTAGAGALGGKGGLGGAGYKGSGKGGNGGNGGKGGHGGAGGGGAGGISAGIAHSLLGQPSTNSNVFSIGTSGKGGLAGAALIPNGCAGDCQGQTGAAGEMVVVP
jgi:hypothetical protein